MSGRRLAVAIALAAAALVVAIVLAGRGSHETRPQRAASGVTGKSTATGTSGVTGPARGSLRPPSPRTVSGPHDRPVPILMYHVINSPPPGAPNPSLYVPARTFQAQMRELAARGYHGVTLGQVFDYWRRRIALPPRPLVVSFDDGTGSIHRAALPVLRRLGWPGVVNLELADTKPSWGLRPAMVRSLIAAGWEIDSHTLTHPDLTQVDAARLRREVAGSRRVIQRRFGVPARFFCYPAGRFDAAVLAAVRSAGYLGATTTQPGLARPSQPFTLARVRVEAGGGALGPANEIRALGG
jgi:peptidoglycan/xylan/chitin deacetylase (PgdA/CDA1 family)